MNEMWNEETVLFIFKAKMLFQAKLLKTKCLKWTDFRHFLAFCTCKSCLTFFGEKFYLLSKTTQNRIFGKKNGKTHRVSVPTTWPVKCNAVHISSTAN